MDFSSSLAYSLSPPFHLQRRGESISGIPKKSTRIGRRIGSSRCTGIHRRKPPLQYWVAARSLNGVMINPHWTCGRVPRVNRRALRILFVRKELCHRKRGSHCRMLFVLCPRPLPQCQFTAETFLFRRPRFFIGLFQGNPAGTCELGLGNGSGGLRRGPALFTTTGFLLWLFRSSCVRAAAEKRRHYGGAAHGAP